MLDAHSRLVIMSPSPAAAAAAVCALAVCLAVAESTVAKVWVSSTVVNTVGTWCRGGLAVEFVSPRPCLTPRLNRHRLCVVEH